MSSPSLNNASGMLASSDEGSQSTLDYSQSRAMKKEHDKIVKWTQNQFRSIRNARTQTERQWYLNLAFFFGKQNVALLKPQMNAVGTGMTTRLWIPPAPYYRARPVINLTRPTIRHELSQLTNNKPTASVIPASAEDRDMYAANAGEQIWDNYYREKNIKAIIRRTMWWTLTCGTGFMKSYWDATEGPKDPQSKQPQGDVCYSHETPFHVLCPDFREEELESQPFLIHAQVKSPEFVKMRFQKALDGSLVNPSQADAADILEDSFMNLVGTQTMNRQQSVLVLECWIKPGSHPMFPEGAFYTVVGDKIVQGFQGWPFSHGKFPFAKFDHIPGGKFYGTSSIEDLIPLQKEYNRTRGQIIEAKNRMAKPQLIAPRGSIDPSKITTEPGQVILYTPGFQPPQPLPLSPLPSYVVQEIERIRNDWNDISGQHEVSHGQVPPGVTAATAISYLQERDESKLSPSFDSLEEGIQKIAHMTLSYVADYWTAERVIKVTGPDGSFDALAFKGSDLNGNLDIKIEAGSSMPTSKAAKQALIMDLMKMGFIDPQKGLEVMDMGGINKIYEQIQVDQRQVQRENLRMSKVTAEMIAEHEAQFMQQQQMEQQQQTLEDPMQQQIMGEPSGPPMQPPMQQLGPPPPIIPVNTWDNHKVHIEGHNNYRKGQAFENLPPETKALYEQHVMMHIQAMGVEMQTMNPGAAIGMPGLPLGPEEPGQPGQPQQPGQSGQPGPMPMPKLESGGQPQ